MSGTAIEIKEIDARFSDVRGSGSDICLDHLVEKKVAETRNVFKCVVHARCKDGSQVQRDTITQNIMNKFMCEKFLVVAHRCDVWIFVHTRSNKYTKALDLETKDWDVQYYVFMR